MSALLGKLKSNWIRVMLSTFVMIVFLLHAADVWRLGFVDQMENLAYDQHLRATMPNTLDDSVVIVDIDEVSLTAEGRWPWARNKLARLIENLFDEYQVRLVGFDIVFAEADDSSGLTVLEDLATAALSDNTSFRSQLQMIRPKLDYDGIFGETIQKYPIVLGYYFNIGETARINTLPEPAFEKAVFQAKNVKFMKATGYGANLNALGSSALGAGHFTQQPDGDGVVRRVPMLIRLDDSYYSSLSLEMVRHVLDVEIKPLFVQPLFDTGGYPGLEWLAVGDVRIPVDEHVRTLVTCSRTASCSSVPARRVCSICGRPQSTRSIPGWKYTPTSSPGYSTATSSSCRNTFSAPRSSCWSSPVSA